MSKDFVRTLKFAKGASWVVRLFKVSSIDLFLMSTALSCTHLHVKAVPISYQRVKCGVVNLRCYIFNLTH